MRLPLVRAAHVTLFEHDFVFGLFVVRSRDENALGLRLLAHCLLFSLLVLHQLLGCVMSILLLRKLVQENRNIPFLHVAQFIACPQHTLLRVIVDRADREIDDLSLFLAFSDSNLLGFVDFTNASKQSVLDVAGRDGVEVQKTIDIGRYYAVCALQELADHYSGRVRFIRVKAAF